MDLPINIFTPSVFFFFFYWKTKFWFVGNETYPCRARSYNQSQKDLRHCTLFGRQGYL